MHIVEMRTKIISMGTFFCASIYALSLQGSLNVANALVMGLATLLVDMGTTGFNTFFDYWRGTDNIVHTKEQEKVLVHEGVSPFMALLVSLVLFGSAALLGLYLAWMTSWKLILVGGACMLVGFSTLQGLSPFQELRWESCLPASSWEQSFFSSPFMYRMSLSQQEIW